MYICILLIQLLDTMMVCCKISILLLLHLTLYAASLSHGRYKQKHYHRHVKRDHESNPTNDCMFNICNDVPNYPEDEIESIIKKHTAFHSYFGGNVVAPGDDNFSVGSRINGKLPTLLCKTKGVSVEPKQMADINGVNRTIPNVKGYIQVLRYEMCEDNYGECYPVNDFADYKFACHQKYTDVTLVTVNLERKILEHGKFRVPSTCVCKYVVSESK